MTMTIDEIQQRLDEIELSYFVDPKRPKLMLGMRGVMASYQFVLCLEEDGEFLQFRTVGFLNCPKGHNNLDTVLRALGEINYRYKLIKLGWDPSDGELVVYIDVAIEDGILTKEQFVRLLKGFVSCVDESYGRIKRIIDTGEDPGSEVIKQEIMDAVKKASEADEDEDLEEI